MRGTRKNVIFVMGIFSILVVIIILKINIKNQDWVQVTINEDLLNEKILRVDNESASIGDIINFTIKIKVSQIEICQNIQIESILSKGLTIKDISNLTITIGEKEYEDFSLKVELDSDNITTLKIKFQDLVDIEEDIIINYSVLVNDKAVIEKDNTNSVKIIYSDNETTKSVTDVVHVYVYTIDFVNKNYKGEEVEDVKFVLQLSDEKYAVFNENNIFIDSVEKMENATVLDSDSKGKIKILGLKEGSYKLIEIEAPEGYNKPDFSFDFIISQSLNKDGVLQKATFDYISDMSDSSAKKYIKDLISLETSFEIEILNTNMKENIIQKIFF